jgi:AcrR family transcriptional regulator
MYVNRERRRSQEERRAATRRALVEAGRELFAAAGYHGVAAEEIVGRAGVTRGALYHHFAGKRGLFRAVVEEIEAKIDRRIARAVEGSSGVPEAVMAGHYAFLDCCVELEVRRVLLQDGPSVLGWEEWHGIETAHALEQIEAGLRALVEEGWMESQPVRPLARLVHGALIEAGMYIAAADDPAAARVEVGESLRRLVEGLRRD